MVDLDERLLRWLPHRPPMLLLDQVIDVSADSSSARLVITEESSFYMGSLGGVPSCVGLEYMGQTAAVSDGWQREQGLVEPHLGFFLGCRRFTAHVDVFELGDCLNIHASGATFVGNQLVNFACSIECEKRGVELASGSLSVLRKPL